MELHLGEDGAAELGELLRNALGDLSAEIADTDNPAFRRELIERRRRLDTIALNLSGAHPGRSSHAPSEPNSEVS